MTPQIEALLNNALDFGISEFDFWQMTLAEIKRSVDSKVRVREFEEKQRASFDYVLADLIGRSVARIYSSGNKMPSLAEAYPSLFSKEAEAEAMQQKKDELSAMRFRQFAISYNQHFEEVGEKDE